MREYLTTHHTLLIVTFLVLISKLFIGHVSSQIERGLAFSRTTITICMISIRDRKGTREMANGGRNEYLEGVIVLCFFICFYGAFM